MINLSRVLLVSAGLLAGFFPEAEAQIRASERASVTQTVDGTVITVDYARPRQRGRDKVFGGEVKWEEIWTPGANMATTLELSKPVQINGHAVPKGKYSVWIQVNQGDWVFMLDTTASRFHTDRPSKDEVMLKFDFRPEERPAMEVLTWWFPDVKSDRVVLAMQWDRYYVPLTIRVESSYSTAVSADVARPIIGSYEMRFVPPPPDTSAPARAPEHAPADSGHGHDGGPPSGPTKIDITYRNGSLFGSVDPAPFPGYDTFVLLRMKDDWFIPAWYQNNEIYDASDEMVMEFKIENGKATGFSMRMKDDNVIATGSRKP
jgi:hypothetical protein